MIAVIDASVAAPPPFPYEIISAINVVINRKRIKESVGYTAVKYITSLVIGLRSFKNLIVTTFQMARQYGLSTYDCAYMALAEKEKCNLITGDKKFFNAIRKHFSWVTLIGDYL